MTVARCTAPQASPPREAAPRRMVVINGDDFGLCPAVNRAVMRAHHDGVLTSASLMIGGSAAHEAVELARATHSLAVGLHLVLSEGVPLSPVRDVRFLVDASGRFHADPLTAGLAFLRPGARRQLHRELRAQFEAFAETGLPLSHVDGHMHLHVHPAVFPMVLELASEYGAAAVRVPREPWRAAYASAGRCSVAPVVRVCSLRLVSSCAAAKARGRGLIVSDQVLGISRSGAMDAAYVLKLLHDTTSHLVELVFHPTEGPRIAALGPNPGDLRVLLDPRLKRAIEQGGIHLTNYARLRRVPDQGFA